MAGDDYELARQTLGVSLLDSMTLFPLNIVVEGPSDEILLAGALNKLAKNLDVISYDVKFFPAGNATSATYLFESLRAYNDGAATIRLIIDGDHAGKKALEGLFGPTIDVKCPKVIRNGCPTIDRKFCTSKEFNLSMGDYV